MESRELALRALSAAAAASDLARQAAGVSIPDGDDEEVRKDLSGPPAARQDVEGTGLNADQYEPAVPTAFITWAHRHSSMSTEAAQEWERQVAEFATTLRQIGVDVDVDLYHLDDAEVDWTRYGPDAIRGRDFVLVAASPAWKERWEGTNHPAEGAGAAAEADALKGIFQQDQMNFQRRVKIVLLGGQQAGTAVPAELWRLARYEIEPEDPDSALPLLRAMTGQPRYLKPPLGAVPILPPAFENSLGRRHAGSRRRGQGDLSWMLAELQRTAQQVLKVEALQARRPLTEKEVLELQVLQQKRAALQGVVDALAQQSDEQ
jgi:hypothetical protein